MTVPPQSAILNLALPKIPAETHVAGPSPHSSISHPSLCNPLTMPKVSTHTDSQLQTTNTHSHCPYMQNTKTCRQISMFDYLLSSQDFAPTAAADRHQTTVLHFSQMSPTSPAGLSSLSRLPPLPFVSPITSDATCEQAARLLFLNVHWARDLTASTGLTMEDQFALLMSSWRDLFLLATAQMIPGLDPAVLLSSGSRDVALTVEVSRFREIVGNFHMMHLDQHEYACVRAMVLFNSGLEAESAPTATAISRSGRLREPGTIARLRDSAQLTLGQRLNRDTLRFGKLLLLLPTLHAVSARAIEELFFKRTIGDIPIERIICDMYKTL